MALRGLWLDFAALCFLQPGFESASRGRGFVIAMSSGSPELPRQRDLLPLRLPCREAGITKDGLARGTRQRISRRLAAAAWMQEGIQTLNHLYGKPSGVCGTAPVGSHAAALDRLEGHFKGVGPPPKSRPEEALSALLGSMSVYGTDHIECKHASFDEAKVSWPAPGRDPVKVAEILEPDIGKLLTLAGTIELLAEPNDVTLDEPVKPCTLILRCLTLLLEWADF